MHTEVQTKDKAPTGNRLGPNYSSVIFFYSLQELHLCQSQWCPSERIDRSLCHTTLDYKPMKTKIPIKLSPLHVLLHIMHSFIFQCVF